MTNDYTDNYISKPKNCLCSLLQLKEGLCPHKYMDIKYLSNVVPLHYNPKFLQLRSFTFSVGITIGEVLAGKRLHTTLTNHFTPQAMVKLTKLIKKYKETGFFTRTNLPITPIVGTQMTQNSNSKPLHYEKPSTCSSITMQRISSSCFEARITLEISSKPLKLGICFEKGLGGFRVSDFCVV